MEENSSNDDARNDREQTDASQTHSENMNTESNDADLNSEPILASSAAYILAEGSLKDRAERSTRSSSDSASTETDKEESTGAEDLTKLIDELASEEKEEILEDEKSSLEAKNEAAEEEEKGESERQKEISHGEKDGGLQAEKYEGREEHEDGHKHLQNEVSKEVGEHKESVVKDKIPQTSDEPEAAERTEFDSTISDESSANLDKSNSPKTMSDTIAEEGEAHHSKNDEHVSTESSKVDDVDKNSVEQDQDKQSNKEDKEGQGIEGKTGRFFLFECQFLELVVSQYIELKMENIF